MNVSNPAINIKFKPSPLRLVLYAVFFTVMLFMLLPLSRMFQDYTAPDQIVRSIELATTPPPPQQREQQEEEVTVEDVVEIEQVKSEIEVEPLDVQLESSLQGELQGQIGMANFDVKTDRSDIMAEIQTFSLAELDETPVSLNDPLFQRPERAGFEEITALVRVILTENGSVIFQSFEELNNQEAREQIREYVGKLKFTAPTRNGEVGRVEFLLPFRSREILLRQRQEQRRLEGATPGVSSSAVTPP